MKPLATADEQARELRLKRMKRIPLALLLLMAVLFFVTLDRPEAWAGWLHAFAEAGMVGALADWFAVVALFRHPLGIPIPHTAIISSRKDELGDAMARFVSTHFLDPEAVRAKLDNIDLSRHTIDWLGSEHGQDRVVELGDSALRWALAALDEERVRKFIGRVSRQQIERVNLAPLMGSTVEWLVEGDRHQELLTQVVRHAIVLLHDHRDAIRERVQQESPWWIPGFVDDRIMKQMLQRIEARLFEISLDPDHEMRRKLGGWLRTFAHELKPSPEYRIAGDRLQAQLLENNELQDYLYGLWEDLSGRLSADLDSDDSRIRSEIRGAVSRLAKELSADEDMQAWINEWLKGALVVMVSRNREQISSLISDTVRTWDGEVASRRVELALGKDLQFIRINGTLVGGLVGVVIHALKLWL